MRRSPAPRDPRRPAAADVESPASPAVPGAPASGGATAAQGPSGSDLVARQRRVLELNDDIAQGLAVAKYALEAGDSARAAAAIDGALATARKVITELLGEPGAPQRHGGGLIRSTATTAGLPRRRGTA